MKISYLIIISIILQLLIQNVISDSHEVDNQEIEGNGGPARTKKFQCGRYEKFKRCACSCAEKCEHKQNPGVCPKEKKVKGCYCLQGFFRNSEGKCVPADQCYAGHPRRDADDEGDSSMEGNYKDRRPTTDPTSTNNERAVKRNAEEEVAVAEPDDDKTDEEGIVQGGLPPGDLAEVLGDDSPTEKNDDNFGPAAVPEGIVQGGLRPEDLDGYGVPEEESEPMYPEDDDCGPNEKYMKCGHKCKESLGFVKKKKMCPKVCRKGCFCKKGFFRDGFSNCNQVPDKYLKDIIGGETKKGKPINCIRQNEKYDDCGDRCSESLANLNNYTLCKPYQCVRGCYCEDGFLRDEEGVCIPARKPKLDDEDDEDEDDDDDDDDGEDDQDKDNDEDEDENDDESDGKRKRGQGKRKGMHEHRKERGHGGPHRPQCPRKEIFSECGNRCMESVDSTEGHSDCDTKWCDVGCFCRPGLHRNRRGSCIPPSAQRGQLSRPPPRRSENRCPKGETFSDCGNRCMESVGNYFSPIKDCNPYHCDIGCFCIPGLFRGRNGQCTDIRNRPSRERPTRPSCPKNEGFSECGNRCMESLENMLSGRRKCNSNNCDVGCFCLPELFRNRNGQCIELPPLPPKEKPEPVCKPNEEYKKCGNDCGRNCANYLKGRGPICTRICWSGCFCKKGFFLGPNGDCLLPKDCGPVVGSGDLSNENDD